MSLRRSKYDLNSVDYCALFLQTERSVPLAAALMLRTHYPCSPSPAVNTAREHGYYGHPRTRAKEQAIELKRVAIKYPGEWQDHDHAHGQSEHFKLTPCSSDIAIFVLKRDVKLQLTN